METLAGVEADPGSTPAGGTGDVPVWLAQASLGFLLAGLGPYVLLLAAELDRPREQLMWLPSTFGVGLVLAALVGPVAMRAGPEVVLRFAAAAMAIGATVAATVSFLPVAVGGALLIGLGGAAIVLATPAVLRGPTAAVRLTRVNAAASSAGIAAPLLIAGVAGAGLPGRLAMLVPVPGLVVLALRQPRVQPSEPRRAGDTGTRPSARRAATSWALIVLAVSSEFCFVIWGVARVRDAGASVAQAAALSAAFPVGMALGRIVGPRLVARGHPMLVGCLTAMGGGAAFCAFQDPWPVTAALAVAGLGIAVLYPVTLARLVDTPGLSAPHAASLGALASGIAILTAPALLSAASSALSLRVAFLLPVLLLAALLVVSRNHRP